MRYDIKSLSARTGFDPKLLEKVLRISDVMQEISRVKFLRERLCLYGGTALNFMYFPMPRLSFDLDFNYRQISTEDWGRERDSIDAQLKRILKDKGYPDLAIQSSYPLLRMDVKYRTLSGLQDSFKIETGYMRRIPILKNDAIMDFSHIGTGEKFPVMTPIKEELFSNKVATMIYRGRSRDMFDAYHISKMDFDRRLFVKCFSVECVMRGMDPEKMNASAIIEGMSNENNLKNMILGGKVPEDMQSRVESLLDETFRNLTGNERDFIRAFHKTGAIETDLIDGGDLNPVLKEHPSILWAIKNRK